MYECTPRARLPAVRLGLVGGRAARHGGPAYSSAARRQALARCGRVTVENSQYHLLRGAVDTVSLRCVGACGVWRELTLRCDNVTRAWLGAASTLRPSAASLYGLRMHLLYAS